MHIPRDAVYRMRVSIELATSAIDRSIYIWGGAIPVDEKTSPSLCVPACQPVCLLSIKLETSL
jgi:hypothetical protein